MSSGKHQADTQKEKGKKKKQDKSEGRRASGSLPPLNEILTAPLPVSSSSSLSLPRVRSRMEDFPSSIQPIHPLPFTFDAPQLDPAQQLPISPPPPSSPPTPPISQTSTSSTQSSSPSPPTTDNDVIQEVLGIARKFKADPKFLMELSSCKEDVIKLLPHLNLLVKLKELPVRNFYKCKSGISEVFIYSKKSGVEVSMQDCDKTLNFSGTCEFADASGGAKVVMNWIDRKKFGSVVGVVDARRYMIGTAKAEFTLVAVSWEPPTSDPLLQKLEVLENKMNSLDTRLSRLETSLAVLSSQFFPSTIATGPPSLVPNFSSRPSLSGAFSNPPEPYLLGHPPNTTHPQFLSMLNSPYMPVLNFPSNVNNINNNNYQPPPTIQIPELVTFTSLNPADSLPPPPSLAFSPTTTSTHPLPLPIPNFSTTSLNLTNLQNSQNPPNPLNPTIPQYLQNQQNLQDSKNSKSSSASTASPRVTRRSAKRKPNVDTNNNNNNEEQHDEDESREGDSPDSSKLKRPKN